jgi:protein SCO1
MNRKFIYLFLALALPGLIFVFLKKFGKNEFTVPVYFETGVIADSICNFSSSGPYQLADSIIQKVGFKPSAKGKLAIVYPFVKDDLTEVNRIIDKYKMDSADFVILSGVPNNPKSDIRTVFLDYNDFGNIVMCGLRVHEPWSIVLLDERNQIRGFYDGSRGEMDRLDLELSILLKKY